MNTNLYEILKNVDPTHRVKFTAWESDFRNVDWPTMMEFSHKTTSVDASTNTLFVYFKEVDDCSFDVELLKILYNGQYELYDNVRFFFDDIELKPSFGDVGHSDKITHIDFEPIKKYNMPIIYPAKIRRAFRSIDLEVLKNEIVNNGFTFVRDGGFKPEDEPFKFCNYLFYINNETGMNLRIGYNYPLLLLNKNQRNVIFEICYCPKDHGWWTDITPDFRQTKWRKISDKYIK